MTTLVACILLAAALSLYVAARLLIPRPGSGAGVETTDRPASGEVESALLRRPLRSRQTSL